jgi:hypothetical protein
MKLTTEDTGNTEMNDGGPAFPSQPWDKDFQPGMSLRDLFAGQALTGLMMSQWGKASYAEFAKKSYAAADAMLFERSNYLKEAK